jgi:hypothetical protein
MAVKLMETDMFEQKINPEKFFLRDICYLRDTAKAFLHETSASNNKAFDGHSAIQLLANDRFMDRSLGGRSANFAQDPLTCHRPAMSAHLHHCSRAVRQVTASLSRQRTDSFAFHPCHSEQKCQCSKAAGRPGSNFKK